VKFSIRGSILATRLLGPNHPHNLVSFGAGGQIEAHIDLHLRAFPSITTCVIINRSDNERLSNLLAGLRSRFSRIEFQSIVSDQHNQQLIGQHLLEADIICTATSSRFPLFDSSFVRKGVHINLIGSYTPNMLEVDAGVIRRAGKIAVDSKAACLIEAGELIRAGIDKTGLVELGELAGIDGNGNIVKDETKCASVKAGGDITIFKSVGVGLQDVAIADLIVNRAKRLGIGINIGSYGIL
jgi:ornithine cyclodeaminase/alanine dehydrogenase-like protein (mu-crystallin family)